MSKFDYAPQVRFNRSSFDLSHEVKTAVNVGDLVPLDIQEVLPGDTFKCDATIVSQVSSAFLKPVMDNLTLDVFHFFVPLRLVYKDAEKVFGNASPSQYMEKSLLSIPQIKLQDANVSGVDRKLMTVSPNSVADYLGLPIGTNSLTKAKFDEIGEENLDLPSVAPFRAFAKVYDEWFRNENVIDEMFVQDGEAVASEYINNLPWSPNNYMGKLPKVRKRKDYFTSCLPGTQKGDAISIGLVQGRVPVITGDRHEFLGNYPMLFSSSIDATENSPRGFLGVGTDGIVSSNADSSYMGATQVSPANLWADLSLGNDLSIGNVNDLRFAFQLQRMLEVDALYGSRYNSYLMAHFGVSNPDSRLQFTEYLGGGSIPLNIQTVAQTSAGTDESPQANLSGFSTSVGRSRYSKGFSEHGYVLSVGCIRQIHTYSQGINKMWFRKSRNDFYDPLYAHLGEQPVYVRELYAGSGEFLRDKKNLNVFGYNEAWADYRYRPNIVTGAMRPQAEVNFDKWTFADNYATKPTLSKSFIEETATFVDRSLAVESSSMPSFLLDIWFNVRAIRVMPTYSDPSSLGGHR